MGLKIAARERAAHTAAHEGPEVRPVITPTLLGMILCVMIGWAPLLGVPPLIASIVAWRDRNLPSFYLTSSLAVVSFLLAAFMATVLRTPFL